MSWRVFAPVVAGALTLATLGCHEAPTSSTAQEMASATLGAGASIANGHGTIVTQNCYAPKHGVLDFALVPVNETDWWITPVEMLTSTCRNLPDGRLQETYTVRALSDIPLPTKTVRGSVLDANGAPRIFDVYFEGVVIWQIPINCLYDGPGGGETWDATFVSTPAGISSYTCRFAKP